MRYDRFARRGPHTPPTTLRIYHAATLGEKFIYPLRSAWIELGVWLNLLPLIRLTFIATSGDRAQPF